MRKGGDLSYLFCDECRDMIARHKDYSNHSKPAGYWYPWAREKAKVRRALNMLEYGDYKWELRDE